MGSEERPMHLEEGVPGIRLKNATRYEEGLMEISRGCGYLPGCFSKRIVEGLSNVLGQPAAQAVIHYMPPKWKSDPKAVVDGLTGIFHDGADVILQRMVPSV
jgi:hypothetical protein